MKIALFLEQIIDKFDGLVHWYFTVPLVMAVLVTALCAAWTIRRWKPVAMAAVSLAAIYVLHALSLWSRIDLKLSAIGYRHF